MCAASIVQVAFCQLLINENDDDDDCVTTGYGLKMASTAAYNLSDNHRYSIANFNLNLTFAASANLRVINVFIIIIINTLQQLNILTRKQRKYCRKLTR